MEPLKAIYGVEIFASGKWNGDEYTVEDLDEMVRAYEETKATIKPSLKLGHDKEQKLLQKDGYPAAGWVTSLRRVGNKLLADFSDIPSKIAALIEQKAYRKVSSEIYWNIELNGKKYKRMLSKVALLGEDMPAVVDLNDMLALYGVKKTDSSGGFDSLNDSVTIKEYTFPHGEVDEMALEIADEMKDLKKQMETLASQTKNYSDQVADLKKENEDKDTELAQLRKYKTEADAKVEQAQKDAEKAKLDVAVADLEKEKLLSPAMKPYVAAFLGEDVKVYSIAGKDVSRADLLKTILKLHSAMEGVNTEEITVEGNSEGKNKDAQMDSEITKYAAEHNVPYGRAYRAVMKAKGGK